MLTAMPEQDLAHHSLAFCREAALLQLVSCKKWAMRANHTEMPSAGGGLEDGLGRCWQGMLAAMAEQDQPGHSLAATLRQKASMVQDLMRNLEIGLQHSSAAVRSASYAFWHTPSVQCTLGQHLKGAHLYFPLVCATQIKTTVLSLQYSSAVVRSASYTFRHTPYSPHIPDMDAILMCSDHALYFLPTEVPPLRISNIEVHQRNLLLTETTLPAVYSRSTQLSVKLRKLAAEQQVWPVMICASFAMQRCRSQCRRRCCKLTSWESRLKGSLRSSS